MMQFEIEKFSCFMYSNASVFMGKHSSVNGKELENKLCRTFLGCYFAHSGALGSISSDTLIEKIRIIFLSAKKSFEVLF